MKVAIFHDYFGAIGGGERVVLTLAKILGADVITTDTDAIAKMDHEVRIISLGRTIKLPHSSRSPLPRSLLLQSILTTTTSSFSPEIGATMQRGAITRTSGIATHQSGRFTTSIELFCRDRIS